MSIGIAIGLISVAVLIADIGAESLSQIYRRFPDSPSERYKTFAGVAATLVAIVSVAVGLITFILSSRANRVAQRKQHTISILLETRLSDRFKMLNVQRRAKFPEYHDVTFEDWNEARLAQPENTSLKAKREAQRRNEAADAVVTLLNYYEFLAVGIAEGDLDETLLKRTLRGIMCNLVDDCRNLICEMRKRNPRTYENLAALYEDWRRPGSKDINGNENERAIPKG
ncbi:DUF4760 domain-containing protein [Thalassococcus lentus]|uniref:DUF4760 domain-containing protein n=1 Tax=Thalassococcus lentus TaxID=1210524 RepID=A0ABT4XVS1_9RHOB|nr:DUF4760 domain-containing protein [Thalassococcus lentus]MDA7426052.1 DUF4760 domain-containing protein [Thalassococcus lentus]